MFNRKPALFCLLVSLHSPKNTNLSVLSWILMFVCRTHWIIILARLTCKMNYYISYLISGCTNPEHLVAQATKFCTVASYIFQHNHCSFFLTHKNVYTYQFRWTEQKMPHNKQVHKPLQNCRSSVWNLLHVTLLAPRICSWLLHYAWTPNQYTGNSTCHVASITYLPL